MQRTRTAGGRTRARRVPPGPGPAERERAAALAELRGVVRPGGTVYVLRVSMSRGCSAHTLRWFAVGPEPRRAAPDCGRLVELTGWLSTALGLRLTRTGARWHGGGSDPAVDSVMALGRALFPSGCALTESSRRGSKNLTGECPTCGALVPVVKLPDREVLRLIGHTPLAGVALDAAEVVVCVSGRLLPSRRWLRETDGGYALKVETL